MSDEAPAVEQDQPTDAEAPVTDQPTPTEDSFTESFNPNDLPEEARGAYEAAYKRLQGDYTRKTQELSSGRQEAERNAQIIQALQDPQLRPNVLQQFGIDLVDEEEDPFDEPDPNDRIERLEQTLAQQQEAAQAAQRDEEVLDYVAGEIESLEQQEGREFDAGEHKALDGLARAFADQNGVPDVQQAYAVLDTIGKARANHILEAKKAPRRPGSGTPGSKAVDRNNKEERERVMAEAADAMRASQ